MRKKQTTTILIALIIVTLSANMVFALTNSVSNSNYRLTGASNLNIGSSTWTASSSSSTTKNVDYIFLETAIYVDGIVLHEEDKSSTNTNLISYNSQTWNKAYFTTFENMSYHSSYDTDYGDLNVISNVTY
ncbi:hypothetical protein EHE19_007095 [Ruminiclostridium herbifermentans]|uniref:Uncharacterized protein n=1 Tax=Ruminiclostridium herbifermentans TaxID=2488810 RepID=A0A4U7JM17_9FIRM|nr:hypothetical protein [Ruminiclostridium herbifermentans]QNU68182.1 hypothetical protein EHE19_007095 [Ruminiclostridium herbifermentans]